MKKDELIQNIHNVVYQFADLAMIKDKKMCDDLIYRLSMIDINDAIDTILVSLDSLLNRKILTTDQVVSNADLLLTLNPEKYKTPADLIKRLEWIKSMNMEYPQMLLSENHKLIVEVFDKFNRLIGIKFDCFYTGGLMGYLAINHPLERYHSDLDLFINENQLMTLYELIQQSKDFEFVSNMDYKEKNGHEFKITYKDTSMSIGLFLFERLSNKEMVLKDYFYPNQDKSNELIVNENHIKEEYAALLFPLTTREHNGFNYRMQSLEAIYYSKRYSRPKDRYDAQIIQEYVDMDIIRKLDMQKKYTYSVENKPINGFIVKQLDELIHGEISKQNVEYRKL